MFSENLIRLIEIALIDGVITEKEKSVLSNKASIEGIDPDEFDMMLDAYLFQRSQQVNESTPPPVPETKKDIERCPSCNDVLPQYSTVCRSCGEDITIDTREVSIAELLKQMKQVEERNGRGNPALLSAFDNTQEESSDAIYRKCELIRDFIVPLNKAEILSFLSIAIPHARKAVDNKSFFQKLFGDNNVTDKLSEAWRLKCEQIIVQSRFAMKDDPKTLKEINDYANQLKIN